MHPFLSVFNFFSSNILINFLQFEPDTIIWKLELDMFLLFFLISSNTKFNLFSSVIKIKVPKGITLSKNLESVYISGISLSFLLFSS